MRTSVVTTTVALLIASRANASPNLSLDDPAYEQLAVQRALGRLPAYAGGLQPISRWRAMELLDGKAELESRAPTTWWVEPFTRASARLIVSRDRQRPYSTLIRPRDIAGGIALSCGHKEGRPCGGGFGADSEYEASAGYARWVSASLRLRGITGSDDYNTQIEIDRAYVNAELASVTFEVGRDVLVFGPSSHTQLGWGDNAAPLDHARVSTSEPLSLSSQLRVSAAYILGRLRPPQTYSGDYVSVMRAQLDVANEIEIGVMQLLQLGGDGAAPMSLWDFIAEHVRRRDASASMSDSSNRRFGGDISVRLPALGARLYYAIMFEDIRRTRFVDAVRYDADHLFGVDAAAVGFDPRYGLTIELIKTGVRSQEHTPRVTGFTNRGLAAGSPLGPDATSLYLGARIATNRITFFPWLEYATLSSDTYTFVPYGPIDRTASGPSETRYRAGARLRRALASNLRVELEVAVERVQGFGFEPDVHRSNALLASTLVWAPAWNEPGVHPRHIMAFLARDADAQ